MLSGLMQVLGAPPGRPPEFYRDVALGYVAVPTGLVFAIVATIGRFNAAFYVCGALFLLCLLLAKTRTAILAVPIYYAGIRFVVGFWMFQNMIELLAGIVLLAIAFGLARLHHRYGW
jgi:hypothetical protein